jgi:hypothetical protein
MTDGDEQPAGSDAPSAPPPPESVEAPGASDPPGRVDEPSLVRPARMEALHFSQDRVERKKK